ncbi:dephospho-CoA kinase [candidate division KSB1 bacterium]|nr:MAG: dephospho-CoA kinase [candidate division KSB1 bacterium]
MQPFLIGLTGGLGAGKTTAAEVLAELGAEVVSGDELGKQVLEGNPDLLNRVRERFGKEVFSADGMLLRRALGERVFARPEDARWLTGLTFPDIYRLWKQAVEKSGRDAVVLDAALIFEWKIENKFDLLLIVTADSHLAAQRIAAQGRMSETEAKSRLAHQVPAEIKEQRGHVVLRNDGNIEDLRDRVRRFWMERVNPELKKRRQCGNVETL